jgi:hypothetical protein
MRKTPANPAKPSDGLEPSTPSLPWNLSFCGLYLHLPTFWSGTTTAYDMLAT